MASKEVLEQARLKWEAMRQQAASSPGGWSAVIPQPVPTTASAAATNTAEAASTASSAAATVNSSLSSPSSSGARKLSVKIGGSGNQGASTSWGGESNNNFSTTGWALAFSVDENDNVYGTCRNDNDPSGPTKTLSGTYNRRTGALDATATFSSPWEGYTVRYTGSLVRDQLCVIDMHNSQNDKGKGRGIAVIEEKD